MYLVDTNILMDYPNFIKENLNNIVISEGVIGELDKLKEEIDAQLSLSSELDYQIEVLTTYGILDKKTKKMVD